VYSRVIAFTAVSCPQAHQSLEKRTIFASDTPLIRTTAMVTGNVMMQKTGLYQGENEQFMSNRHKAADN
jgi:hypothetical protein